MKILEDHLWKAFQGINFPISNFCFKNEGKTCTCRTTNKKILGVDVFTYLSATINSMQQLTKTIMGNTATYRRAPIKSSSVFIDQILMGGLQ